MSGRRGTPFDLFQLSESGLWLSDNTIGDVSTARHGFVPKAPNDTNKFLRGDATWANTPAGGVITAIAGATVATDQSTNSTSYTDLATVGPSVTLTTGAEVYITLSANIYRSAAVDFAGIMSVAVSGATTLAASDSNAISATSARANSAVSVSRRIKLTGLTPGSNTFTAKYRTNGGGSTFNFNARDIVVEVV